MTSPSARLTCADLRASSLSTLYRLALAELLLDPRPACGSDEVYARANHQARLQLEARALKHCIDRCLRSLCSMA